jgi:uncharacterized protein (TIGR04255 family)
MNSRVPELPAYERPPVSEVSVAVTFEPLDGLSAFAIGEIWTQIFKAEFPQSQEQPPLVPQVEQFGAMGSQPQIKIQFLPGPPSPRFWFLDPSGSDLVQIQRDWFSRNWRRTSAEQVYPRFPAIRDPFERELVRLSAFLSDQGIGTLTPVQCEVSYVNPIVPTDLGRVSSFLRQWRDTEGDFLKEPENLQANFRYLIADDGGKPFGRLHVGLQPAIQVTDGSPIYLLTLTARGAPNGYEIADVMGFVDIGHQWIVRGFADIATDEMQEAWGRIREP